MLSNTKLLVKSTSSFNNDLKMVYKQRKDISKLINIVEKIVNNKELELKYKNHKLVDNKKYKNCYECHIEPDWLLVYQIVDDELILLLINTGSHSELFKWKNVQIFERFIYCINDIN